jgi:uracil-DNA glycosylase
MSRPESFADQVRACRLCVQDPVGPPLAHEPRPVFQIGPGARVLIASQAPGTKVHASGRPFTDASGDRLRDWLGIGPEIFYDASRVAIVPMGLCFPGQDGRGADLPPRRECAPHWQPRLMRRLGAVELVLAIGMYAQSWHLGGLRKPSLTETVRAWREPYETLSPAVIPLPHPSWRNNGWLAREPWFERELLPAVRAHVARLVG